MYLIFYYRITNFGAPRKNWNFSTKNATAQHSSVGIDNHVETLHTRKHFYRFGINCTNAHKCIWLAYLGSNSTSSRKQCKNGWNISVVNLSKGAKYFFEFKFGFMTLIVLWFERSLTAFSHYIAVVLYSKIKEVD